MVKQKSVVHCGVVARVFLANSKSMGLKSSGCMPYVESQVSVSNSYLFNSTIAGIEKSDSILIIASNPRIEAPVLNARIRKRYVSGETKIALIGEKVDLTFGYSYLGNSPTALKELLNKSSEFGNVLRSSKFPMLILGQGALTRSDGESVLGLARQIAEKTGMIKKARDWNGFNVLHTAAGRVGALELGFYTKNNETILEDILTKSAKNQIKAVYLLGADEIDMNRLSNTFVIYQGHTGDTGANHADVVLPGAAYTEKNATYVNTEGRAQQTKLAIFPPGEAKEDWSIIRALSEVLKQKLPYDSLEEVRKRMGKISKTFQHIGQINRAQWEPFGSNEKINDDCFLSPIQNYYMTDPITRCSVTMAKCTKEIKPNSLSGNRKNE